jgi:hypothetical protein
MKFIGLARLSRLSGQFLTAFVTSKHGMYVIQIVVQDYWQPLHTAVAML